MIHFGIHSNRCDTTYTYFSITGTCTCPTSGLTQVFHGMHKKNQFDPPELYQLLNTRRAKGL